MRFLVDSWASTIQAYFVLCSHELAAIYVSQAHNKCIRSRKNTLEATRELGPTSALSPGGHVPSAVAAQQRVSAPLPPSPPPALLTSALFSKNVALFFERLRPSAGASRIKCRSKPSLRFGRRRCNCVVWVGITHVFGSVGAFV